MGRRSRQSSPTTPGPCSARRAGRHLRGAAPRPSRRTSASPWARQRRRQACGSRSWRRVGAPGSVDAARGVDVKVPNIDGWDEPFALGPALAKRLGVPPRGRPAGRVVPRCLLGRGRGRRAGARRPARPRARLGRRDRPHVRQARRKAVQLRPAGLRRGVRQPRRTRGAGAGTREPRKRRTDLFDLQRERGRESLTSGVWLQALAARDRVARDLVDEAVDALGAAVGSAVSLLDVELVVVGGGLGERRGPTWLRRIERGGVCPCLLRRAARVRPRAAGRPRRGDRREPPRLGRGDSRDEHESRSTIGLTPTVAAV